MSSDSTLNTEANTQDNVASPATDGARKIMGMPLTVLKYATAFLAVALASPAFAQLTRATTQMQTIQTWIVSIGLIVFTICFAIVGYRMAFNSATWGDVFKIAVGGLIAGGAAGFAALVFS
ncbi:MAG: TrbC/VirB2 family protein [Cellvibrionaceae bacterium]